IETKQNELCLITSSEDDNTQKVNELNLTLNKMVLQQSQLAMNVASAKMSQQEISEEIQKNTEELQQKSHDLESYKRELDDANELLKISCEKKDASYNSCNGYKLKLESKRKTYEERKAHLDTLTLKIKENEQSQKFLQNLEQNLEGYAYSVKEIIKRAKNKVISGVLGTVSQIINVSNEYSLAIETALGAAIQNIVVENETTAKNAIRVLKQENLGRATFLPLTSVSSSQLNISSTEQYPGFIGVASSLVKAEEKFKPIVDSLLCRIVVVDDIDTAVLIAQKNSYRFKIVTLDGQVVNAGGSLTGGSKGKQQGLLSRKNEIEELFRQTQKMILQKKEEENTCSQLLEELNLVNAEFVALQSEMQTFSEDTIRFEGEKKRLEQIHLQTQQLVKSMNEELLNKQNRITFLIKQQEDAAALLKQSESETLLATQQLELIKGSQLEFSTKRNELGVLLSDNKIKTIEISKDIQGLQNEMQGILQRQEQGKETLQKLENEKNELANANDLIMEKITKCQLDVSEKQILSQNITIEIEKLYKKRNELEGETTALRKTEKEFSEEKEKIISQSVRYEERKNAIQKEYDEIIGKLWEEYELTRSEAAALAVALEDIPKSTASLNSVKTKIRALGSVNVAAIEEYKEVSCRYEYLFAQIKDIESAKLELTRLITELTQQMKELFSDSFAKINDNFSKIFVDLFGGGKAQLRLTEPENVLESGIEIIVEPPGKIIKNLSMLSGGEQTFIAIAIYFAILKVRPAPFCMLDEIEAALDDVNVVKYATYLRQLTDKTQFILITHRRGTMEEADILYGVTMQEEGVSKLLTLKVTEIEQRLGMKEKDS
ncbi:MAG: chromosome segregation protein SMC, partial [Oscillospiraceae bacterium]